MVRRRSAGWVPDQHGAWAMITIPVLMGVVIGGPHWRHLPLLVAWWVGYFFFHAASLWVKSRRKERYLPPMRVYGVATVIALTITLLSLIHI